MKTVPLKVGKRTFALAFTLDALCELQENIKDFDLNRITDYTKQPAAMRSMITAFARQGELLEGRVLDVDAAWFGSHISPGPARIISLQLTLLDAINAGMIMESEDDPDAEVDVALEELKKKEPPAG